MDIKKISEIVVGLDDVPNIMDIRVGHWCVWPVVKRTIRILLLDHYHDLSVVPSRASLIVKDTGQLLRLCGTALMGVGQLLKNDYWCREPQVIVLTDSNSYRDRLPNGRYIDIFFDDLLNTDRLICAPFVIEDGLLWEHMRPIVGPRHLYAEVLLLASEILARRPGIVKEVKPVVKRFARLMIEAGLPIRSELLEETLLKRLCRFEGTRRIYRMLFLKRNVKGLLLIDSNSRHGQIAAAKELNIPVIEFQHGLIGNVAVGCRWCASFMPFRAHMPIPDKLLVYGRLWQDLLVSKGFWNSDEVIPIGSGRIDRFRFSNNRCIVDNRNVFRILFTSQWFLQKEAIQFWSRFMKHAKGSLPFRYDLYIKPHPSERHPELIYKKLVSGFSSRCKALSKDESTFQHIMLCDVHVSFSSTTLIESLGLGVPTVSIRTERCPEGILAFMPAEVLQEHVVYVESAEMLIDLLSAHRPGSKNMERWRERLEKAGKDLFLEGFLGKASLLINRELRL